MSVPLGIAGVAAALLAFAVAVFVLATGRQNATTRMVAVLLVLEGVAQLVVALPFFGGTRETQVLLYIPHVVAVLVEPAVYLFVLSALDTPIVRPLRRVNVRRAIFALTGAALAIFVVRPGLFYAGLPDMYAATHGGHVGTGVFVAYGVVSLIGLFAIVASVSAFRRAPKGSLARSRAGAFTAAFGTRDGVLTILLLAYPFVYSSRLFFTEPFQILYYVVAPFVTAIFGSLVAYGILKTQLFDIDIRVKTGLRRTFLTGTFLVLVLTAIYLTKDLVAREFGVVVGSAATGVIIFFLPQLRKASEKAADLVMPGVDEESPTYVAYRKLQVYRLAVESASEHGDDPRSRAMLDLLRQELHIRDEDRIAVEREVAASRVAKPA